MANPTNKSDNQAKTWIRWLKQKWRHWSRTPDGDLRPWYQSPSFVAFAIISCLLVLITIINYPNGMPQRGGFISGDPSKSRQEVVDILREGYRLVRRGDLELAIGRFHDALKIDSEDINTHFALMLAYEGLVDNNELAGTSEQIDSWRLKSAEHARYLLDELDKVATWPNTDPQWVGEAFVNAGRVHARQANWIELKQCLETAEQAGYTHWEILETATEYEAVAAQPEFQKIRARYLKR